MKNLLLILSIFLASCANEEMASNYNNISSDEIVTTEAPIHLIDNYNIYANDINCHQISCGLKFLLEATDSIFSNLALVLTQDTLTILVQDHYYCPTTGNKIMLGDTLGLFSFLPTEPNKYRIYINSEVCKQDANPGLLMVVLTHEILHLLIHAMVEEPAGGSTNPFLFQQLYKDKLGKSVTCMKYVKCDHHIFREYMTENLEQLLNLYFSLPEESNAFYHLIWLGLEPHSYQNTSWYIDRILASKREYSKIKDSILSPCL